MILKDYKVISEKLMVQIWTFLGIKKVYNIYSYHKYIL